MGDVTWRWMSADGETRVEAASEEGRAKALAEAVPFMTKRHGTLREVEVHSQHVLVLELMQAERIATKRAEVAEAKLAEVRKVVTERIATCQRVEAKFAPGWTADVSPKHHRGPPQALVEAWAERQAMAAVLAILNDTETTP